MPDPVWFPDDPEKRARGGPYEVWYDAPDAPIHWVGVVKPLCDVFTECSDPDNFISYVVPVHNLKPHGMFGADVDDAGVLVQVEMFVDENRRGFPLSPRFHQRNEWVLCVWPLIEASASKLPTIKEVH